MANTISIAVSEPLVEYIDGRVASGDYGNRSEYIRDLIRRDQEAQAAARLRALIEEGLASESTPWTADDAAELLAIARGERD